MSAVIGMSEFKVLSSLGSLGSAYSPEITSDLTNLLIEDVPDSTISACLARMEKKSLVISIKYIPIRSKNKMLKRNYRMTDKGKEALSQFRETVELLSNHTKGLSNGK